MKKPRKLLVDIGRRIKELRATCAMTQEALAEETNLHRTYIARVEGGKAVAVSVDVLDQIARALKTDLISLLQPPGDDFPKRVDPPKKFSRGRVTN
jgi:transcriptional regulator with XRE-family HTH domain